MICANEKHWESLANELNQIVDEVRGAYLVLEQKRERIAQLVTMATDLPAPDGDENHKREVVFMWRAMLKALDQQGFGQRTIGVA